MPASGLSAAPSPDSPVGAIYGNVSATAFRVAVTDVTLKRMDYVKVRHDTDGAVLAQITELTRESSLSYDQAQQMGGAPTGAPVQERLTAQAKVVGFRDSRGLLQVPRTPFRSGEPLFRADHGLIANIFGMRDEDGAFLGFIKGYEMPVRLDLNTLVQKHVSVLAKTGSGKSYVVGVLMEELIKRGIPIVVVDPHGEHSSLARVNINEHEYASLRRFGVRPRSYAEQLIEYSPDTVVNPDALPLTLDGTNLSAAQIAECLGGVTNAQMGILHAAVRKIQESEDVDTYTVSDIVAAVRENGSNAKWNLLSALEHLEALGVFATEGTPVSSLVKRDKLSILNLKGVTPEVQELVVSLVAKKLFEERKANRVPPFMLVVEEAHNFCPERGIAASLSSDVLRTIASEGRKFGLGLTVVSQRPAKIDKNVLSQCATQLILKVTNPNDVKAISSSVEGLTGDMEDEIQRLPVGVAIVSHPRLALPVLCEIRPRETAHGGESVDVLKSVQESETFLPTTSTAASEAATANAAANPATATADAEEAEPEEGVVPAPAAKPAPRAPAAPAAPPVAADEDEVDLQIVPSTPPLARWETEAAPEPAPPPLTRPAPPPEPPRSFADADVPPWVAAHREELETVRRAGLKRFKGDALVNLVDDLTERLADLRGLSFEQQEAVADQMADTARFLADAEERLEREERRRNSFFGRLLGRAEARDDEDDDLPPAALTPLGAKGEELSATTAAPTKKSSRKAPKATGTKKAGARTGKKGSAKKAPAKKATTKQSGTKKATAKKAGAGKAAAKKAARPAGKRNGGGARND